MHVEKSEMSRGKSVEQLFEAKLHSTQSLTFEIASIRGDDVGVENRINHSAVYSADDDQKLSHPPSPFHIFSLLRSDGLQKITQNSFYIIYRALTQMRAH